MAKVLVSLPDELVIRIDRAAAKDGRSRSAWLREVAEEFLDKDGEAAFATLERLREKYRGRDFGDPAEFIRHDRDTRDQRH